jgi:hypothetical protein
MCAYGAGLQAAMTATLIHSQIAVNEFVIDFSSQRDKLKLYSLLKQCKGMCKVSVKKFRRSRTNPQNAYYHGVVVAMVAHALRDLGWQIDNEGAHEWLKQECLKINVLNELTGEYMTVIGSTASLDTQEFIEFTDRCCQLAAEKLGLFIPQPNT